MDETTKNLWNAVWTAADNLTHPEARDLDALMWKLLDAAHAYGVAVGRSGFHDGDTLDVLAIQRAARQLRASIDATGRAVDDHESRLAQVEFGVEQWKEQGLLERVVALEEQDLEGRLKALAESNLTWHPYFRNAIATLEKVVHAAVGDLEGLKARASNFSSRLADLEKASPAWTKPDLNALLERVIMVEQAHGPSVERNQLRTDLALAQEANRLLSWGTWSRSWRVGWRGRSPAISGSRWNGRGPSIGRRSGAAKRSPPSRPGKWLTPRLMSAL